MSITPIQMIRTEIIGYIGSIVGLLFASIVLIFFADSWYMAITIFFIVIIQVIGLVGKYQQFNTLKELEKEEQIPEEDVVMVNDGREQEGMSAMAVEVSELINNNILEKKEEN